MSNYRKWADDLMHFLDLSLPPIAISFSDRIPAGVTSFDGVVPAGCVFWQLAATRTFVTSTKDHELCSIGVYTHHMAQASASHQDELKQALEAMSGLDRTSELLAMAPEDEDPARVVTHLPSILAPLALLVSFEAGWALFRRTWAAGVTTAAQVAMICFALGRNLTVQERYADAAIQLRRARAIVDDLEAHGGVPRDRAPLGKLIDEGLAVLPH